MKINLSIRDGGRPGSPRRPGWRRRTFVAAVVGAALSGALLATLSTSASNAGQAPWGSFSAQRDGLGIAPGKIRHVWLIILENKSYDASFTGLNNNTYLWQTLPAQGVLLKDYYGTGHFSLDNYVSLVSGQATQPDTQADCPYYDSFTGSTVTTGNLFDDPNFGQVASAQGANGAAGTNGCVYPKDTQTLFNQLDAAHIAWKGYAQDLGNPDASGSAHSVGPQACGAPYATPDVTGGTAQPNPGSANATDQYVPKHFPFPWFESLLSNPNDCNAAHIANLLDPTDGLYHDLQSEDTTPAFSWISPNNCSDAHDAVCKGNNLSGGWLDPNTPNPVPLNHTGGLYASDLFLEHIVPEIEASPAFKDGGLIDITFDEAFPPFTYTGNSFANSTLIAPDAAASVASDTAGENLYGRNVSYEPTGPNTPLEKDASGNELYPGPGDNAFIDRPATCVAQTSPKQPAGTCLVGGGTSGPAAAKTDAAAYAAASTSTIFDPSIVATDVGRRRADHARERDRPGRDGVLHPRRLDGSRARHDRRRQRDHARGSHDRGRSALRRHRRDQRRRRHRQRADQPLHQAGQHERRVLQPLQLAAHDGGPLRRRAGLAGPRRGGPPGLRRAARPAAVRARRVHQPERAVRPEPLESLPPASARRRRPWP
jgi:hypothetical protein